MDESKEELYSKLVDYCYDRCGDIECIECEKNGKLIMPFCKISFLADKYNVIDTKTLSSDIMEILSNIQLDFYKNNKMVHSISVILELVENTRYKIIEKGDV